MQGESGQATLEWVALVTLTALALAAAAQLGARLDGRSLGGLVAHSLTCAAAGCDRGDDELARAYGGDTAELVRRHVPGLVFEPGERQLPVDWRRCRAPACATAPDDHGLDAHLTGAGLRATLFTRVQRRGAQLYIQYWAYYPDSNTTFAGSDALWERSPVAQALGLVLTGSSRYPGYHRDDWEGVAVRVARDGSGAVATRVTSHGGWQWCKHGWCADRWGPVTGWARVSRGSHAGHVPVVDHWSGYVRPALPGRELDERTATGDGTVLIPIETLARDAYRRLDPSVTPPWDKEAYRDPEAAAS